jgi:hypothetical protein
MNADRYIDNDIPIGIDGANFFHLKDVIFAEYNFRFHLNDGYHVDNLEALYGKHQLLFQKIESKTQQLNLMMIDSVFPLLLADVVLDIFFSNRNSFGAYSRQKMGFQVGDTFFGEEYLKFKFYYFIKRLLYSKIAAEEAYLGEMDSNKIFYFKNIEGKVEYFSIYDQWKLCDYIYEEMNSNVDLDRSSLNSSVVNLLFKISI